MTLVSAKAFLLDMDGVICRGASLIPGATSFLQRLTEQDIPYLLLTNNSEPTPQAISDQLGAIGADLPKTAIYTASFATAAWGHSEDIGKRVMVLGETGLEQALTEAGYTLTTDQPD